jgi:hypothetical protein
MKLAGAIGKFRFIGGGLSDPSQPIEKKIRNFS